MKIVVFGASGRMGKAVCAVARRRGYEILEIEKETIAENIGEADVAIDFSLPSATKNVCDFCRKHHCPLVTGVTGRNDEQQKQIDELKNVVAVKESVNFSEGIDMLRKICEIASELNWDCEIVETHRKGKTDSPSGTAKELATIVLKNSKKRTVQIHALRVGSNFGKHEVVFATEGESLTFIHQAENSEIFAKGAVDAAEKSVKKKL